MRDMKSMKLSQAERSEAVEMDRPEYPYGLSLRLGNDELEKLGIDMLPDVGGKRMMNARVEVVSTNRREEGGEIHRSLHLQITDMALSEDEGRPAAEAAEIMYRDA